MILPPDEDHPRYGRNSESAEQLLYRRYGELLERVAKVETLVGSLTTSLSDFKQAMTIHTSDEDRRDGELQRTLFENREALNRSLAELREGTARAMNEMRESLNKQRESDLERFLKRSDIDWVKTFFFTLLPVIVGSVIAYFLRVKMEQHTGF